VIGSGGLNINGNVNLIANPTNSSKPDLNGVLFYDTEGTSGHPVNVTINGNSNRSMVAQCSSPTARHLSGNAASGNHCTEIVANQLTSQARLTSTSIIQAVLRPRCRRHRSSYWCNNMLKQALTDRSGATAMEFGIIGVVVFHDVRHLISAAMSSHCIL
jgi:hypothetical protein